MNAPLVDNADYGACTPFTRATPYVPLDTLQFDSRYQWKSHLFVPDHEHHYVVGDKEGLPQKLARALIAEGIARPGDTLWEAQEPFEFRVECIARINKILVPRYSRTDFYSIPRLLWWMYPPTGIGRKAAHIHDLLCRPDIDVQFLDENDDPQACIHPVSDLEASMIFREAMAVALVPQRECALKYYGTRSWFGPRFEAQFH